MAKIIRANGNETVVRPRTGKHFRLEELQKIVGGYIETLPCPDGKHIIVCNEEGKLMGMPYNKKATDLYGNPYDHIVGDVLYCNILDID